jgi:glutamate N-acetyltransferase/amino-acid N-acetyltransferase
MTVSPLAPGAFPELPGIAGVRLSTHAAGLRYRGRADLMLAEMAPGTTVAGVFTSSLCPSAPVDWCRAMLGRGTGRLLVCNSGNANAFTGQAGQTAARATAETIAAELGVEPEDVMLASTGVIAETLPTEALIDALPLLAAELTDSSPTAWADAAAAIRTTDTFSKGSVQAVEWGGLHGHIVGIAKGSGMIAPDMATMLAFLFTDVPLAADVLQGSLEVAVERSFNRITVDSDTSTSDTVLAFSTGVTGADPVVSTDDSRLSAFQYQLDAVCLDLAHQIVRDGEGATKFVSVTVHGAESAAAAKAIALSIGNSPLVKTALAAEDANWGRIVMAVGKAGQSASRDALAIWIGDEQCAENGVARPGYDESRATEHLRQSEIELTVDVGVGDSSATIWTCDLTHGYIEINAGYRS